MSDLTDLTNMVFAEAPDDPKVMKQIASTAINRLKSGRVKEFGSTLQEVLQKGYYAVSQNSPQYQMAVSGKFDEQSEKKYKRAMVITSSLLKETVPPDKGLFFFKPQEEKKLRKNPKAFNFKMVTPVGKSGEYNVYDYK